MTLAHPPPRGCTIDRLIAVDGENWAHWALLEHPVLLRHVLWQADSCQHCKDRLTGLFPEGVPEVPDHTGLKPDELEDIFRRLRQEAGKDKDATS